MLLLCWPDAKTGVLGGVLSTLDIPLANPPVVFAKVRGRNGSRELRAIISPASEYTILSSKDALQLGYNPMVARGLGQALAITPGGIMKAAMIKIEEIDVGDYSVKGVGALCYELPEPAAADLILGKTFLEKFSVSFDYDANVLHIAPREAKTLNK